MPPRSAAAAARGCGLRQRGAGGMGASGQMSQSQFAHVSPHCLASSTEKADWEEQIRAEQSREEQSRAEQDRPHSACLHTQSAQGRRGFREAVQC